jgi:uncharacterized protein
LLVVTPDGAAESASDPTLTASWPQQVWMRLEYFALFRAEIVLIVPSAVVLFLLGSRLVRAGAFTPAGARIRRRLMVVGLGVGVPLNALAAAAGPDWFFVDRYLAPPLVALGVLGLATTLVLRARREPGPLRRGLTAVGRTALSGYVLQNVLAAVLCYGWGFGLAERFAGAGPWFAVALWAGISIVLLAAAPLWLRHFTRGPLELVMHRMYSHQPARSGGAKLPSEPGR